MVYCWPEAANGGAVEIRDAVTGHRIVRFAPKGQVVWASLSSSLAAVLVQQRGTRRIELYNPATGRRLRSTSVPRAAKEVAVSGERIVYLTTTGIHQLGTTGARDRFLARAAGKAFSLSFEGRSIVWAEDGKVDRIRELQVAG